MSTVQVPDAILERLRANRRFLITSHANPDGDAVGTSVGLARLLRKLGKATTVWLRDPTPALYLPATEGESLHHGLEPPPGYPDAFETAIVLECPSLDRTGLEQYLDELPLVNIDHHLGNELYGVANWVDSAAPAVGEMVLRIAHALRLELDEKTATPLYLALATDTGGFRFANTTPRAFLAGADLVENGAHPEQVSKWLHESRSASAVRLVGEALRTLELHHGKRVATIVLTSEMFERSGADQSDTEGIIDYPRSIDGVETAALIRELPDGGFKVSLRSRGDLDVESVARRHEGGGHKNAAGFSVADSALEAVRDVVVAELGELVGGDV